MKIIIISMIVLFLIGCSSRPKINQTIEFRHFLWTFFNNEEFQKGHVVFPLEFVYYEYDEKEYDFVLAKKYISKGNWKPYSGPEYYRCETSCLDLVMYDNFERQHKNSNERVLSFEGVHNGIFSSLYFKRIRGEWYLVKHEDFDN